MGVTEKDLLNVHALSKLGYGMYVIGSRKGERLNAQIANTLFQITSQPPTVAVSINKGNLTHEFIHDSGVFSASILCQDTPLSFIGRFGFKSGRETNKLEGVTYRIGETGAPIVLDNVISYMEIRVIKEVDMGTHTIFIGEVISADTVSEETCLTYSHYQEVKRGTTPKAAPSYVEKEQSRQVLPTESGLGQVGIKTAKYRCSVCGYVYDPDVGDPESGIKAGTPFEELLDDWTCPICGATKADFEKLEET